VECHQILATRLDHLKNVCDVDVPEDLDVDKLLWLMTESPHSTVTDDDLVLQGAVEVEVQQKVPVE